MGVVTGNRRVPRSSRRRGVAAALTLALGLALALQVALPSIASAASVSFGTPSATSKFGDGVDFVQPVSASGSVRRYEIVIEYPQATGPAVTQVDAPAGGSLVYHLDTSQGQLVPNTPLVAHWRVTFDDGTVDEGPTATVTYADNRFQWRTKSSALITLHWYQGDDTFASRALAIGEAGVAKAAALLGTTESKPIDFFVYADQSSFYDALGPGTRENVGGEAHPDIRTLFALITPADVNDSWVNIVVPHELTHVVFDDVVHNPYHYPPHWLNEGLAVYLTAGYDASAKADMAAAVAGRSLMPLAALAGQFPTVGDRFQLGYDESVSAVDFLVNTYGKAALVKLIQTYATGVDDDTAFKAATGLTADGFDQAWLAANGATAPTEYGPRPAPTGPLPPGWTANGAVLPNVSPGESEGGAAASPASSATAAPASTPASTRGPSTVLVVGALAAFAALLGFIVALILRRGPGGQPPRQGRLW